MLGGRDRRPGCDIRPERIPTRSMQLNDDVHVLELPMVRDGQTRILNLTLIVDAAEGPTLGDAGLPGHLDAIASALGEAGAGVGDLRLLVLTHQDVDHVGSLPDLVE